MIELPRDVGVVLDLDDTLYSERSYHDSGFRWIAVRAGLDPDGDEVHEASWALRHDGRPLDILGAATDLPVTTLLDWHRSHSPAISLYPDAASFIRRAHAAGVPLVLITDGRSTTQRRKIEALGIREAFRAILISEETGVEKHSREAFERAGRSLLDRAVVASFGDNPGKDVRLPLALGWTTFLLLDRGDNVHDQTISTADGAAQVTQIRTFDEVAFPEGPL